MKHTYRPKAARPLEVRYRHYPSVFSSDDTPPEEESIQIKEILVDDYDILPWMERFGFNREELEEFLLKHHDD